MNILLVNDDGINSDRLLFTKNVLKNYGKVLTVAPSLEQSGMSSSITIGDLKYQQVHISPDDEMYSVEGTPVDCITVALLALDFKPDLVVSGVNKGFNLGIDTIYSGTVGAAINAKYYGLNAIALSADPTDFQLVKDNLKDVIEYLIKNNIYDGEFVVNINFPDKLNNEIKDYQYTTVYGLKYELDKKISQNETQFNLSLNRKQPLSYLPKDSDLYAVRTGNLSISKIKPYYKIYQKG